MKQSKNTVKNKLIATLMLGLTIAGNTTISTVMAMSPSKAGTRGATIAVRHPAHLPFPRSLSQLNRTEQEKVFEAVQAILSMMINPSKSNITLAKKLYNKATDQTIAELLYQYLIDIKNNQKPHELDDLKCNLRRAFGHSKLSEMKNPLKNLIDTVLAVKNSPSEENAHNMITFYTHAETVEKTIIYNQMLVLQKQGNPCANLVLKTITASSPEASHKAIVKNRKPAATTASTKSSFQICAAIRKELEKAQQIILSIMANPSASNIELAKKLYEETLNYPTADLIYYFSLVLKSKKDIHEFDELKSAMRKTCLISTIHYSDSTNLFKELIDVWYDIESNPTEKNAQKMLLLYSQFNYYTKIIIYNQMFALAKNKNSAAEEVLKNICSPVLECPVCPSCK